MIQTTFIGSNSDGNCVLFHDDQTRILVDAGIPIKVVRQKLLDAMVTPETLDAIIVTHEHLDHIAALHSFCLLQIPVYITHPTFIAYQFTHHHSINPHIIRNQEAFTIGSFQIQSFPVPHDAADPIGLRINNIAFLTDLGHITPTILKYAKNADTLFIEANHDLSLLAADTTRPDIVKRRIASSIGHLSNIACAMAVQMLTPKNVALTHLSKNTNSPLLALSAVKPINENTTIV